MEDFPQRIAEMLESAAARVRAMTVDRVANAIKWIALGPLLAVLALFAGLFLLIGLYRMLGELVGVRAAYAITGGLILVGALFLWSRRHANPEAEND